MAVQGEGGNSKLNYVQRGGGEVEPMWDVQTRGAKYFQFHLSKGYGQWIVSGMTH